MCYIANKTTSQSFWQHPAELQLAVCGLQPPHAAMPLRHPHGLEAILNTTHIPSNTLENNAHSMRSPKLQITLRCHAAHNTTVQSPLRCCSQSRAELHQHLADQLHACTPQQPFAVLTSTTCHSNSQVVGRHDALAVRACDAGLDVRDIARLRLALDQQLCNVLPATEQRNLQCCAPIGVLGL
jgi:hypothetical protein